MKLSTGNPSLTALASAALFLTGAALGEVHSPFSEKAEFARYAERMRESVLLSLEPGAYTIQGTSRTGVAGSVLLEIYEVP